MKTSLFRWLPVAVVCLTLTLVALAATGSGVSMNQTPEESGAPIPSQAPSSSPTPFETRSVLDSVEPGGSDSLNEIIEWLLLWFPIIFGAIGITIVVLLVASTAYRALTRPPQGWDRVDDRAASQPDVEELSRALRAGHGLASGMHLVSEEMRGPIADEFGRVFEEQNLGIPLELALRGMADRIPVMDVRFFVIAVVIQRATGGDLAEVLDKIGRLIRQRFELQGHVRALTAEGRLSGVVLLALPPGLLGFLSFSNYSYISVLFTTDVGNKMLLITAGLQLVGAWMIKKIVAIKV